MMTTIETINLNTLMLSGKYHFKSYFENIKMYNELEPVHKLFKNKGDYPILCISTGPSLKNYINQIKKAQHSHLIICVDSSLKILIENNIKPDIVTASDSYPGKFDWIINNANLTKDIILVAGAKTNSGLVKSWKGKKYIYLVDKNGSSETEIENIAYPNATRFELAYTVANMSLTIASHLTKSYIVLVGQDLCIKGNSHCDGASLNTEITYNIIDGELCFKYKAYDGYHKVKFVKDYNDKDIVSMENFYFYIKMFEKQIINIKNNVYNLTKYGAKIENAKRIDNISILNHDYLIHKKKLTYNYYYTNNNLEKMKSHILKSIENIDQVKSLLKYGLIKYKEIFTIRKKEDKVKILLSYLKKSIDIDDTVSLFLNVLTTKEILEYKKLNDAKNLVKLVKKMIINTEVLREFLFSALI